VEEIDNFFSKENWQYLPPELLKSLEDQQQKNETIDEGENYEEENRLSDCSVTEGDDSESE
jgi:hypothetical protein